MQFLKFSLILYFGLCSTSLHFLVIWWTLPPQYISCLDHEQKQDSRSAIVLPVQVSMGVPSLLVLSSSGVDFPALVDRLWPIVWRFQAEVDA